MSGATAGRALPSPPGVYRSGWRRRGGELARRAADLLYRARSVLSAEVEVPDLDDAPGRSAEVVSTVTWLCIERLREHPPPPEETARICELVSDLQQLGLELYEHEMASRARRIALCESGLVRLRALSSSADLVDRACEEVVRSCRFTRVVLSRVDSGIWTPWMAHFEEAEDWIDEWVEKSSPLDEMILETQLLMERRADFIYDTSAVPVHPIVRAGMSRSYVVAPIMPAGNVVGFFHADHGISGRRCDDTDRDVLWAFADGFGHIYERTVLLERLRSHAEEIGQVFETVMSTLGQLSESEIELAGWAEAEAPVTRAAVSVLTTMSGNMEELTPRELEVLQLMAAGAKNQAIAEQLVITEGTVKSHVKHILRKLGAVNRSQAIAHYLGLSGEALE